MPRLPRRKRRRPLDLISVILPTLDRGDLIGRQLECLASQDIDRPFEVIVADNGSVDDTASVVGSFSDRIERLRLVDASRRRGVAAARNIGVAAAAGPLLAFCDSDDAADPAWLREIIAALEANEGAIVAGRVQFAFEGRPPPTRADWHEFSPRGVMLEFLAFADTASMAIRRADLDRVGGFDERFRRCSDVEVSYRAQTAGLALVDAPGAMMIKYQPSGIKAQWRQSFGWCTYHAALHRKFRHHGMPRRSNLQASRAWAKIAARAPLAFNPRQRTLLRRMSPEPIGRLVGSLRHRTWFP